jgi:hypothetical protein
LRQKFLGATEGFSESLQTFTKFDHKVCKVSAQSFSVSETFRVPESFSDLQTLPRVSDTSLQSFRRTLPSDHFDQSRFRIAVLFALSCGGLIAVIFDFVLQSAAESTCSEETSSGSTAWLFGHSALFQRTVESTRPLLSDRFAPLTKRTARFIFCSLKLLIVGSFRSKSSPR